MRIGFIKTQTKLELNLKSVAAKSVWHATSCHNAALLTHTSLPWVLRWKLALRAEHKFHVQAFPGYTHRRTMGFKEGSSMGNNEEIAGLARTFVFEKLPPSAAEKAEDKLSHKKI